LSLAPQTILGSVFWQDQSLRFRNLREETLRNSEMPLEAWYHPDGWGLDHFRSFQGRSADRWLLSRGTSAVLEDFKSVASICAVALGSPNTDLAWTEWLDCIRRDSDDFQAGETSMSSRFREWRPEPDVEIGVRGLLSKPPETRPDPNPVILTFDTGEIDDVCGTSERVCRRLADEALKIELVGTPTEVAQSRQPREPVSFARADASRTMTLKEAVAALRTSDDTLHRLRKKGEIDMFKVGSRWRVRASEVHRLRQQPRFRPGS
jgi:excisionase family DNA binding protein